MLLCMEPTPTQIIRLKIADSSFAQRSDIPLARSGKRNGVEKELGANGWKGSHDFLAIKGLEKFFVSLVFLGSRKG